MKAWFIILFESNLIVFGIEIWKKATLFTFLFPFPLAFNLCLIQKLFVNSNFAIKIKKNCKCQEKFVYLKFNFIHVKIYLSTIYRIGWMYCIVIYWNYRVNTDCEATRNY